MKLLNFIIILGFIAGCNAPSDQETNIEKQSGIKRKFVLAAFNYGVEIYLKEDLTFMNYSYMYGCVGGYRIKKVLGNYKLTDNHIEFFPQKLIWQEDWTGTEHYFESKKTYDTVPYYTSDSTKIQTRYWYLDADTIEFLISEAPFGKMDEFFIRSSNFIALANLYNSNSENKLRSEVFCNLDTVANVRTVISKNLIPQQYKEMFFEEPHTYEIISVKVNKDLYPVYRLVKKDISKSYTGMQLYSDKFPDYPLTVVSANNDTLIAKGESLFYENTKLGIGMIVRTDMTNDNQRNTHRNN